MLIVPCVYMQKTQGITTDRYVDKSGASVTQALRGLHVILLSSL